MVRENDWTLVSGHTIQYTADVSQNCTLKTYIIFLTKVAPINLIKILQNKFGELQCLQGRPQFQWGVSSEQHLLVGDRAGVGEETHMCPCGRGRQGTHVHAHSQSWDTSMEGGHILS